MKTRKNTELTAGSPSTRSPHCGSFQEPRTSNTLGKSQYEVMVPSSTHLLSVNVLHCVMVFQVPALDTECNSHLGEMATTLETQLLAREDRIATIGLWSHTGKCAPNLLGCVTFIKVLNLSVPLFPQLSHEGNPRNCLTPIPLLPRALPTPMPDSHRTGLPTPTGHTFLGCKGKGLLEALKLKMGLYMLVFQKRMSPL